MISAISPHSLGSSDLDHQAAAPVDRTEFRSATSVGVVVIGRNEGARLRTCLESIVGRGMPVAYVDSGSTDGSVALAIELGASVVNLETGCSFSAARARNAGFERLLHEHPTLKYVQFVDGDCEIVDSWISTARQALDAHPDWAVVAGRRRERSPDATIYNKLCDIEWNTPVGQAHACGGDAMMRTQAFVAVSGFNPHLIAGEEPELCVRLRRSNWVIWRLDAEMTRHDAAMFSFRQWRRRTRRAGHAYAEGAALHGRSPQKHWARESRSIWIWGLIVPVLALALAWPTRGLSLLLLLAYPVLAFRVYRYNRRRGLAAGEARMVAFFTMVGKFPEALGQIDYWLNRLRGRRTTLIEYKGAST